MQWFLFWIASEVRSCNSVFSLKITEKYAHSVCVWISAYVFMHSKQRMRWLEGITHSMDMNLSKLQEIVKNRGSWRAAVHVITKSRTHLVTEQQLWAAVEGRVKWSHWGGGSKGNKTLSMLLPHFAGPSVQMLISALCSIQAFWERNGLCRKAKLSYCLSF